MSRQLSSWLDGYVKFCENSEPPQSYHVWNGVSTIAGTLQRKAYMKWGMSTLYPNLYIVLVGPSGWAKKGTSIEFSRPFIKNVGAQVIEGAITREKLIRRMGEAIMPIPDETMGVTRFQCAATFISAELAVFLGQHNIKLLADLCDWYDCPNVWPYDTKGQGTDILEGVCLNIQGAVAPEWLPAILPREAIGGGFTSRVIWVVEEGKQKTVPDPTIDSELQKALANDLEKIFLISGEYKFTEETQRIYSDWYVKHDEDAASGVYAIQDPKFAGYCGRRATLVKKLCMIVSASEGDSLEITPDIFDKALKLMIFGEKKMARAFSGLGTARYAYATEQVLNFIARHKTVTRSQVLRYFFRDIDDYTFDIVARTLQKTGAIELTIPQGKDDVILKLKEMM